MLRLRPVIDRRARRREIDAADPRHLPGIHSAVNAGMAVTILASCSIPGNWRRLGPAEGFPDLPPLDISMIVPRGASVATRRFADFFRQEIEAQRLAA